MNAFLQINTEVCGKCKWFAAIFFFCFIVLGDYGLTAGSPSTSPTKRIINIIPEVLLKTQPLFCVSIRGAIGSSGENES